MANFIDLEDENLINEDENELYMEGEEINDIGMCVIFDFYFNKTNKI